MLADGHWFSVKDGDPRAVALHRGHYSYNARPATEAALPGGRRIVGPAERMILMTVDCKNLFAWIFPHVERRDHQIGVCCTVFHADLPKDGPIRASDLILEAEQLAWARWPGQRLWTYVDARKIKSANPGYCFKMAHWQNCGTSKGGLVILEKMP